MLSFNVLYMVCGDFVICSLVQGRRISEGAVSVIEGRVDEGLSHSQVKQI